MNKLEEAFEQGFQKEAQDSSGLSPAQQHAIRRRLARARQMANRGQQSAMNQIKEHPAIDDAFRGAGIGGAAGAGLGYFKGSPFRKGALGGIIGGATLGADAIIDSF